MSNPYGSPGNPDDNNGNSGHSGDIPSYGDYAGGDPAQGYGQPQDPGNPYGAYPGGADQQYLGGSMLPGAGVRLGAFIIDAIIGIVLWLVYRVAMETTRGASLGKMILGLKVVDANGNNPSAQDSFLRNIWYLASNILSMIPFIGWLFSLAIYIALGVTISKDPQKQSFTDKWGKAYVVRSR
ncbi:RDD family protein [Corynebacterium nuruki]|uniref:RDD family protein n=1 Tax=Corynebacterium nuruki TaxID=1032851 RepID=UPI0039BFB31B